MLSPNAGLRQVISADQIQKRVRELGRQISDDYRGETMIALGILENSFLFMADLVRAVDVPLICSFIKPSYKQSQQGESAVLEILFSHELAIAGKHVLLVEGLVHSGVTSEFLMNDLRARGAASVKLVTLLDRQSARRVPLQPDYFGFLVDDTFLCGYGLGSPGADGTEPAVFGGDDLKGPYRRSSATWGEGLDRENIREAVGDIAAQAGIRTALWRVTSVTSVRTPVFSGKGLELYGRLSSRISASGI